jgi:hypothetical protein
VTVKRSGKESRWAEVPPARTRFAAEAAFLILVAAGAALAQLSPPAIIGLMLIAWLLVALIERASSREHARALAGTEDTELMPMPAVERPLEEDEEAEAPSPKAAIRWAFWRRERVAAVEGPAQTASLEELPSRGHVRKIEPEAPPTIELETAAVEVVLPESAPAEPTVTKRPLELPGLEEPETARAESPPQAEEPAPVPSAPEPQPPEPSPVEQAPPPVVAPPRAPLAPPPPAREWNLWDLERRARARAGDPVQDEEWTALFMNLRQFANADGLLPVEFDDLVRESFSELIQAA